MIFRPSGLRLIVLSNALPRHALWSRNASNWGQHSTFPTFFHRAPAYRHSLRDHLLWLVPLAGGLIVYRSASPKPSPNVFASPVLIPCPAPKPFNETQPMILSPAEPQRSILSRIVALLRDRIWEPIRTGFRFMYLFALFLPVIVSAPMVLVGTPEKYHDERWGAVWWYGLLVRQMQAAGPTFIKLAQWAATRVDLFPNILCERFGTLHSQGRPHSLSHTKHLIERVFQRPFEEVFEEFDEVPIGIGAIAQVYKATLKQDLIPPSFLGPKRYLKSSAVALAPTILNPEPPPSVPTASVAVKILHPGVSHMIARDLSIMSFFAHCITLLPGMQWLSLPEEVGVFGSMMSQQLDLRHEAENLEVFESNFATRSVPVTFPRPLKAWSTKDLLVEEFQNAVPLEMFLRNGGGPYDDQMATVGLDAFLNMLLLDNFVHADLHPGNIMVKFSKPLSTPALLKKIWASILHKNSEAEATVTPLDNVESGRIVAKLRGLKNSPVAWSSDLVSLSESGYIPEIVFVDAGLVTTLDAVNRQNFLDLFRAIAEFDGYRAGQLMVERCRTPELAIETETFALKMQHLVLSVKRKTFSLGKIRISDILTDVLKAVRQHHVKMEGDFINTVISILLLEGIGRQLDPELDLFKSALPILRQLGRQMTAQESVRKLPSGNFGAMLKVWVWLEARELASAALVNADDLIRTDWLTPNI